MAMINAYRRRGVLLGMLAILCACELPTAWGQRDLVFGVFPYVAPTQLMEIHRPLGRYIAGLLDRPVTLVTAPDFVTFVERTGRGNYDIILTAPHFARLAERRSDYIPLVIRLPAIQGVFLAPVDSPIHRLSDLKGTRVMMAQRSAIIFQMAEVMLRSAGLEDGKNITIVETRTQDNAMYAPLRGEATASVTPLQLWKTLGAEYKDRLKIIATTPSVPGVVVMAHKRLPARDIARLRAGLLKFAQTPEGKAFARTTGQQGFFPVDESTMRRLDPYVQNFLRDEPR